MGKIKYMLYKFTGSVYIPSSLKNTDEKLLLHISDTPISFFDPLLVLLKKLKPSIIVHTGDLVDNLKLQFSSNLLPRYDRDVKLLLNILEGSLAEQIYIVPGNHDNVDIIKKYSIRSKILDGCSIINTEYYDFKVSHYSNDVLDSPSEFNLYGHDLSLPNHIDNRHIFLNGISSINVITLETKKVYHLLYPFGTDDMRLKRGKIGL